RSKKALRASPQRLRCRDRNFAARAKAQARRPEPGRRLASPAPGAGSSLISRDSLQSRGRVLLARARAKSYGNGAPTAAARGALKKRRPLTCAFLLVWIPARACAFLERAKLG